MKKSYLVVFILIALLDSGYAFGEAKETDNEARKAIIGSVQTAGNRSISDASILSKVRSRAGQPFDPDTADEDAKRIAELSGVEYSYYNTILIDDKIQLTYVVVESNIVRSIVFVGNNSYKAGLLRKKLGFKIDDYLDPIAAEAASGTLAEFYRKKGFGFVQVTLDSEKLSTGEIIYTIDEGPRVKIAAVKFIGNNTIKTKSLNKAIKIRKKVFFLWSSYYTEEKLSAGVAKLQNIYQKRGFLDANITAKHEFNADKSKVRLTFEIDEGRCFTVEKIVFTGNEHFDEKQLRAELKLKEGQFYYEQKADSDVKQMLKLYREIGFIDVQIAQRRKFVSEDKVNVEFVIAEGQRFRIGRINITGNEQTHDKVIRRVLDEYDFQPGQWYNADIARGDGSGKLERMVGRMAMTESKSSFITPSGEVPGQKDAQVNIIEGQTGMIMVGAGVGSDSGVIGQLVYEQRNFDISDWPENFGDFVTVRAFKGAGQSLRIALQPGTVVSQYSVNFSEPYFRDKPVSLDVVGLRWERWRESYDEQRTKGYVGFEKRYRGRTIVLGNNDVKRQWRKSIGFRVENVEVDDIDDDAPQEIIDVKGDNVFAGVKLGFGMNSTDDKFNPSTGFSFNTSYEQLSGDHTFGILSGIHRGYQTLHEDLAERKIILATKLYGAVALGDAPPFEKFYAGGQGSIRGFDYRGVSTRGLQTGVANPQRKDPIGSDWVFLANVEVTVPLASEILAALFFVDSGAIDSGNYRLAVGTGIQILIPNLFGPVPMRFEFAAPVMKDDNDETQVFSFSIGRLF